MMSLCLVSCGRQPEDNEAPVAVSVVSPQRLQPTTERSYTFISEPYRSTALSFRVGARSRSSESRPVCILERGS